MSPPAPLPDEALSTAKAKERAARPSPSARFIAIRWAVAVAALVLMGAAAMLFSRSLEQGVAPPPPRTAR
jgi:hypothetical protein